MAPEVIVKARLEGINKFETLKVTDPVPNFEREDGSIDYDAEDRYFLEHPNAGQARVAGITFEVNDVDQVKSCIAQLQEALEILEKLSPPKKAPAKRGSSTKN